MFLPMLFLCSAVWMPQDFKSEIDTQIYLLEKQIRHFASEENYNPDFWYAKGKYDAYMSLKMNLEEDH